jgi:hypothetical protein
MNPKLYLFVIIFFYYLEEKKNYIMPRDRFWDQILFNYLVIKIDIQEKKKQQFKSRRESVYF